MPVETIAIKRGIVFINDEPLSEPYTTTNSDWQMDTKALPTGKIFVIGDSRAVAMDETLHGEIATRLVTSRLLWHLRWKR
jgi:signal peptidase I